MKYFFAIILITLSSVFYIKNDNTLKQINYSILSLSKELNLLTPIISELNSLISYKDDISKSKFNLKLRTLVKYYNNNYNYYGYEIIDALEFKNKIENSVNRVTESKTNSITLARKVKKDRDLILKLSLILVLLFLLTEIAIFRVFSRKVIKYLNKLEYKNYNFIVDRVKPFHLNNILEKIDDLRLKLNTIESAIDSTLLGHGITDTIDSLFNNDKFREYIRFDRIGFATIDDNWVKLKIVLSEDEDIKLQAGFSQLLETTSLMEMVKSKESRIINNLPEYLSLNPKSNSTNLIINEGYLSNLTTPILNHRGEVGGFLFFTSKNLNAFDKSDILKINTISNILSSTFSKNMLIDDLVTSITLGFVNLVEGRDPETSNHLIRMSTYSKIIAEKLASDNGSNFDESIKVGEIHSFSPLHDIGKVGIPDKILLKPGRLTEDEMTIMKDHSAIGSKVLNELQNKLSKYKFDFFLTARNITQNHHERWDGKGYPEGLSGNNIPIEARIVTVADVFDALTSKRVYKEAFSFEESIEMIKDGSGEAFDPIVVKAFLDSIDSIKEVYDELKEV